MSGHEIGMYFMGIQIVCKMLFSKTAVTKYFDRLKI